MILFLKIKKSVINKKDLEYFLNPFLLLV